MEFYEMMEQACEAVEAFWDGDKRAFDRFPVADVKAGLTDENKVVREECEDLWCSYGKMTEKLKEERMKKIVRALKRRGWVLIEKGERTLTVQVTEKDYLNDEKLDNFRLYWGYMGYRRAKNSLVVTFWY